MTKAAHLFFPKYRIESLVLLPGGISRETALERASSAIEALREESLEGIGEHIENIETILGSAIEERIPVSKMYPILDHGDGISFLSETFGLPVLTQVTQRLCDLVERLIEIEQGDVPAMSVCARAMRLVSPQNPPLSERESHAMMEELARVLLHYDVSVITTPVEEP
jgi:hypothetical protein